MRKRQPTGPPKISGWTLWFFRRVVRRYFRRHFRAVQVQGWERLAEAQGPLIVYANHSSWWDPMMSVLLARVLLPARKHYAPMDAVPLQRYPILRKIGVFPVEINSPRGAAQFLRTSQAVLQSGGVLWITPQGRFADVRERPLAFKPGMASLALHVPEVTLLPMALEYTFWSERLPEALAYIAEPIHLEPALSTPEATTLLEQRLEEAMTRLQTAAMRHDPSLFKTLLEGRRGTGGFYALGRRVRSLLGGKGFEEDHSRRDQQMRNTPC